MSQFGKLVQDIGKTGLMDGEVNGLDQGAMDTGARQQLPKRSWVIQSGNLI